MKLDPFYLIVDHVDWLRRLLPCGVKLVQLRIKDASEAVISAQIHEAKKLCGNFGAQLIVNDYWRIALDQGCDFIHLGQEDLVGADLAAIRRRSGLHLLVLAASTAILCADVSMLSKAETERIWLPFTVWLTAAPALLTPSTHRWWLAANIVGALAINHFILTNW